MILKRSKARLTALGGKKEGALQVGSIRRWRAPEQSDGKTQHKPNPPPPPQHPPPPPQPTHPTHTPPKTNPPHPPAPNNPNPKKPHPPPHSPLDIRTLKIGVDSLLQRSKLRTGVEKKSTFSPFELREHCRVKEHVTMDHLGEEGISVYRPPVRRT